MANCMGGDPIIFVAGANGMVGKSVVKELNSRGYNNILKPERSELDLCKHDDVIEYFGANRPEVVINCAARVGGIEANRSYPVEFLLDNLKIATAVCEASFIYGIKKLCFLGSSCIYPRNSLQPIKEDYLLTSKLESTNEAYALAKIAGLKLCEYYRTEYKKDFFSVMPCNLYGVGDTYHLMNSHVIPSLIMRVHEAKCSGKESVTIWGTGKPLREFLFVEDLSRAIVKLLESDVQQSVVNIGSGLEVSILDLAYLIKKILCYDGRLYFDESMPDGTPRKLLDSSYINGLGWNPRVDLSEGIKIAYQDFLEAN